MIAVKVSCFQVVHEEKKAVYRVIILSNTGQMNLYFNGPDFFAAGTSNAMDRRKSP